MRHGVLKPHGHIIVTGEGGDVHSDTLQCVHCGGHWKVEPGSGKLRGYCYNCSGPICGPKCIECVPQEVMLEAMEKGVRPDQIPRVVMGGFNGG